MILEKELDRIGALKEYQKAYILSISSLIGIGCSISLITYYLLSGNYIRVAMFGLSAVGMILLFFTFLKQYKTFKFLAMFSVGGVK